MKFIDLSVQQEAIKEQLSDRISTVLAHGQYIMGPEVKELECILEDYVGARHCITVSSGTDALLIALMALGIGPGDEIITTPFTFISTAEVIVSLGATPVFVDVEEDTGLINASLIEAKITKKTKAILPVSLYGQIPDIVKINSLAKKHGGIPVLEDAAQSFGATVSGRRSCGLSTIACTSFFPSKPLGCYGDGGAIFTDRDDLADIARAIRVHGQKERYVHKFIGVAGRMDTLQCAVLLAKWSRFAWEVGKREALGQRYEDLIASDKNLRSVDCMTVRSNRTSVYAQFTIKVTNREQIRTLLLEKGIPSSVHYPNIISKQPAYKKICDPSSTPNAELLSKSVLSLPMGPDLQRKDQEYIIGNLSKIMSQLSGQSKSAA